MSWNDSIVGVCRGDESGWVGGSWLYVVIGGVGVLCFELFGVVRGSVVVNPESSGSEFLETKHVHHAHGRETGCIEIGPLIHAGGKDAAHFHPGKSTNGKAGRKGNVESTVSVKERWVVAVELDILSVRDKHGDSCAIFALVEDLFDDVVIRIKLHLGLADKLAFSRQNIIAINTGRGVDAIEGIEGLRLASLSTETRGRSDSRKVDFSNQLPAYIEEFDLRLCVFEILGDKDVSDDTDIGEGVL